SHYNIISTSGSRFGATKYAFNRNFKGASISDELLAIRARMMSAFRRPASHSCSVDWSNSQSRKPDSPRNVCKPKGCASREAKA
ncbi:unnamed protein product, partial [Haemonchus placei]|uniref:Transposase n=1 Tax=Haemonchus placei TaxID=6290 RepID=A0A0N4W2W6_HAEPC